MTGWGGNGSRALLVEEWATIRELAAISANSGRDREVLIVLEAGIGAAGKDAARDDRRELDPTSAGPFVPR
jgi:hypothetical protein